jgi:serine/threonine-protein kinase HipA
MAEAEQLGVWLDGIRVAELSRSKAGGINCLYSDEALERWPQNSPLLSCSLPLGARRMEALAFCRGLLPEGRALQALAHDAELATSDTFGLIERYGRDVAGALVIGAEPPDEERYGVEEYSEESLREAVEDLEEHPLGSHEDSELSLAGLQDKLLLVKLADGSWGRPLRGRPSTHILKRDDARFGGLIEAEAECMRLASAAGLSDVEVGLETLGDARCLIVSRFDRTVDGEEVRRIHQEDLCQALGIDPSEAKGRAKYERAGGPTLRKAAGLLDSYAADPEAELDRLLAATTFTVLIGNADAHGKNLALLHPEPERIELAPLYDTVPTVLWPKLRSDAAMSIGAQVSLPDVGFKDLLREARIWRHPEDRSREVVRSTISAVVEAVGNEVIRTRSPLAKQIRGRAKGLLAEDKRLGSGVG